MLLVPYAAGVCVAGADWVHLPLLGAWLGGYLLSYFVFQAVKSRRPRRYRGQLVGYAAVTAPLAALVVWARPAVLWYAPVIAVLVAANAWYAWRRRERALANDLASVVLSCLMVFVVATTAGMGPGAVLDAFLACLLYFVGTTLYVKTMIRERGNPAYRGWSVGYHAGALVASAWLGPWLAALFAWLLLRAWVLPGRPLSPKQVGLVEIGNSALLVVAIAVGLD